MTYDMWISLGAILVLIVMSGFFSGSETALTAASRVRMMTREKEGVLGAGIVNRLRDKKDRLLGALLLGNNLVNILASALATSVFIKMVGEAGVVYATLIMTLIVLIFAEVLPKTYALHNADSMAIKIAPVVRLLVVILAPITEMITGIVRGVLRFLGVDISGVNAGNHLELLRGVIELHRNDDDTGDKDTDEQRAMLRSILDLGDVDVSEIMVHRKKVVMVDVGQPPEKIIEDILKTPFTRLPVYRDTQDNIVGVIHAKALLRELMAVNGDTSRVDIESFASEPWFIPDGTPLFDQLQAFRKRREHFALVVDEYGSFMGVVTLEDILEEIVGEIDDEYDISVAGVRRQPNGSYLIDGTVTIRDLRRELDWELPDNDYATIAGLILHEAQCIPAAGQSFHFYNYKFDIVRRNRNQITLVRVTPPKIENQDQES